MQVAGVKLLNLLELFASPRFLFARPDNHSFAAHLMETLNNLVQVRGGYPVAARRVHARRAAASFRLGEQGVDFPCLTVSMPHRPPAPPRAYLLPATLQYQYESNSALVYAILRRADLFASLASLNFDAWRGKQQEQQQQQRRLAQAAGDGLHRQPLPPQQRSALIPAAISAVLPFRSRGGAAPDRLAPADGVDNSEWVMRNARGAVAAADEAAVAVVPPSTGASDAAAGAAASPDAAPAAVGAQQPREPEQQGAGQAQEPAQEATAPPAASSLAAAPAAAAAPAPWAPSQAWLDATVKRALALGTIGRLTGYLAPLLQRHVDATGVVTDDACIEFLRSSTVVGVLPQPHPIVQRVYQPNAYTQLWFSTFTWSTIYLSSARDSLPLFDAAAIRLFQISVAPASRS